MSSATGVAAGWPSASRSSVPTISRGTWRWWSGCAARGPARGGGRRARTTPPAGVRDNPAVSPALVGARTPAEVDANDAGAELALTAAERAAIERILAGVAGGRAGVTPPRPGRGPRGGGG